MNQYVQEAFNELAKNPIVYFITIVIVAPIYEEFLMRGIILEGFLRKYEEVYAILFSALIFGAMHGNIPQFVNAFFLGVIFGFIYTKTRSLLLCMLAHAINNVQPFIFETWNLNLQKFAILYTIAGIILMFFAVITFNKSSVAKKLTSIDSLYD